MASHVPRRSVSAQGISLIKRSEGLRLRAYRDAAGILTVGYGHKILPGESLNEINEELASKLLFDDVKIAEKAINDLVTETLSQNQFDALVSFVFNVGVSAFRNSTMLKKLNQGEVPQAALEFVRWNKATVDGALVSLPGLTSRRASEKELFLRKPTD